jgi:hypothetical protein
VRKRKRKRGLGEARKRKRKRGHGERRGRPVRGERAAALVVDGLGDAEKTISGLKQVIHSLSCSHDSPPSG